MRWLNLELKACCLAYSGLINSFDLEQVDIASFERSSLKS